MKDYLINVKCIQTMDVMVNAKTKKQAIAKLDKLIKEHANNKDLGKILYKSPKFKYKVNKVEKQNKSSV